MSRVIPVASGKGGVGKSLVAANLGLALARRGRTVVLVDLDLGGSNLHTFLGIRNRNVGIGSRHWRQERNLSALLAETGEERLWFIPGDNLLPGVANLEWQLKKKILKELAELPADYVVLDLGAGSSWNMVDFWLAAANGLVVVVPEITSILNAYSFLKAAAFRVYSQAWPEGSAERAETNDFAATRLEGGSQSFIDFARALQRRSPSRGEAALKALASLRPGIVLNRAKESGDLDAALRLRDIARKNLGMELAFAACLPEDTGVGASLVARRPLVALAPAAPFSRAIDTFAARLATAPPRSPLAGPLPLLDLDPSALLAEALGS